jgi:FtsH-binding integral membrane protein
MNDFSTTFGNSAASAAPVDRAAFIRKTYLHLVGGLLIFLILQAVLFASGVASVMAQSILSTGGLGWIGVLFLFIAATNLAGRWSVVETSKPTQYAGLALCILAETVIFVPFLYQIGMRAGSDVILKAGIVSIGLFLGLTSVVFSTKTDFSFLGPIIGVAALVTLGWIVVGLIFGFGLGTFLSFVMVALAGTSILYETSNVLHRYRTDQHVGASLALLGSLLLLFWYILRIFGRR